MLLWAASFAGRTTEFSFVMLYGCTDGCMDVGFLSTSKAKPLLSNENAMTDFRQTWYVGSGEHKYYPCGLLSPNVHI